MTQEMMLMSREEIEDHLTGIEAMRATTGGGVVYIPASELERLCFTSDAYHDQKEINKELYDALDDLVNFTEAMMEGHGCSLIDVARDVLAKARGDQS